ncbi:alpha-galactosidase [Lapidilactobacillus salsurivasis]
MQTTDLIQVDQQHLVFHLHNDKISYLFRVIPKIGQLENYYYGPRIQQPSLDGHLNEREIRPGNNLLTGNYTTSLEAIRQEYPVFGTTDFRQGAYAIRYPDGDEITAFKYVSYQITPGYPDLGELPHARYDDETAATLTITLRDENSPLTLQLHYTINTTNALIIRSSTFSNSLQSETTYQLTKALSVNLDLPSADYDLIHLHGAWAKEMQIERRPLMVGRMSIDSDRGASSHQHNPFIALAATNADEQQGQVYGAALLYSGNFLAQVEVDNYAVTRLSLGISPTQFTWQLTPGTSFQTPEVVLSCTTTGLNGMSHEFHDFYRRHLIDQRWADQPKPILINNWEATYFDFNETKLLQLATKAQAVGLDLFVLDDGWFGRRDSDNGSLGNWTVDRHKLPAGLPHLVSAIHQLGLKFGLWFEPEMISTDTPLFQAHPEWRLGHPDKKISHGRNQYVLDFSNPQVVTAIFEQMAAILRSTKIDYLKWDMNRYISEAFSPYLSARQQGELYHRYIMGVYHLYSLLAQSFPELMIESCAGGGGRFDAGMLYYAPQAWASDDTDAIERLKIQYGASLGYPLQAISSHVSAVPNHQVGRVTPLQTRGDVAMFGTFGYELDITKLSEAELAQIKRQIAFVKQQQHLLLTGEFTRLASPFTSNQPAWQVYDRQSGQGLIAAYQILSPANPPYRRLRLQGLVPEQTYQLARIDANYQLSQPILVHGDELMNLGIIFSEDYSERTADYWNRPQPHDFASQLFAIKAVADPQASPKI